MSAENIIAILGISIPVLSAVAYGIWLLSRIKTQVEGIYRNITVLSEASADHIKECDDDRVKLNFLIDSHSKMIVEMQEQLKK